eukprot:scaffold26962_cov114-Isochrysis_galbana.AAC.13
MAPEPPMAPWPGAEHGIASAWDVKGIMRWRSCSERSNDRRLRRDREAAQQQSSCHAAEGEEAEGLGPGDFVGRGAVSRTGGILDHDVHALRIRLPPGGDAAARAGVRHLNVSHARWASHFAHLGEQEVDCTCGRWSGRRG